MRRSAKPIHLAAHFPGVNNTTVWSDPAAGSHIEFSSFTHLARTAERAKFDFFFLAEGLRLREQRGRIHDLDVVGRPDTFAVLAALAAVTDRIGLAGTINSTFNEPFEVARQFASLDHLSGGRAAWNVVTSWDAFTGENFRRGGYLPEDQRYERAREFLQTARELWDSWGDDDVVADPVTGRFLRAAWPGSFEHHGPQFDISGQFTVPRSPQGHPVIFQAGDSDQGREFAAATADAIFSRHATLDDGRRFYADVKGRLGRYGRSPGDLKILPAATFVLGDTEGEAQEKAAAVRRQQVSGPTAILFLEQVWNRDLSHLDPDGPLPSVDPDLSQPPIVRGRANVAKDPMRTARAWRELAEAKGLSIRELMIEVTARQSFVGTPATVAEQIDTYVQEDASDGFILVPHVTPGGLDDFADQVVPILQERGRFRTEYAGTTLRDHLGLPPARRLPRPGTRDLGDRQVTARRVPLCVLDVVPIPSGGAASDALRNTIDLARRAEELGYRRYWFAEHHLNPGVAGSSPAVVIALVAGATHHIRLGSGGVQSGHRTALSVVEEFGLIDALHPGRLDLGLGRSGGRTFMRDRLAGISKAEDVAEAAIAAGGAPRPGRHYTDQGLLIPDRPSISRLARSPRSALTADLLQQAGAETTDYGELIRDIVGLLQGTWRSAEGLDPHPVPGQGASVEVWVLGSSAGQSASVAGELGLRFVANYHVSPATVLEAVDAYRAAFQPSADLDRPYLAVSADVVVGADDAGARELAAGFALWVRSIRRGEGAIPFPTPEQAACHHWTDEDRSLVADRVDTQFVGSAPTVAAGLERLQESTGADELIVTTITHDHADRVRSYELLAEEWLG